MYARSIVEERIELAERKLGFSLEYHRPNEIDDFAKRLEEKYSDIYATASRASQGSKDPQSSLQTSLLSDLGNPEGSKLSSDEIRFIQNERALCMCDAGYFMESYYWIKSPTGIVRFAFLPAQRIYMAVVAELEKRGCPIELIILKARQLGISTVVEGLTLHRVNFGYGINAVVASADQQKTGKMAQMTFMGYDMLPWWMAALSTRRVESDKGMLVFGGLRSGISFQHGSQTSGIARGDTVKIYHLSECASYANPKEQIEASLFKCVHPFPDVFGNLESTAEGDVGWFADTYWYSKLRFDEGQARNCALFLSWCLATEKYPTITELRTRPVPDDWEPCSETRSMMSRAKAYIHSNSVLEKVVGHNWELSRERAWYWERNFLEHRAKGIEKLWYQEMPTDDKEAFQSSYDNVFGREVIAEVDSRRRGNYHVYTIIGQSIEDRYEPDPDEIDEDEKIVPVSFTSPRGVTYRWELVPVQFEEWFSGIDGIKAEDEDHLNKFFVWLDPQRGYDYSIGIRTGTGIGIGQTVISVARRARNEMEQDEQAAEFRSYDISHVEAYAWAMAIASYYSRYMGIGGVTKRQPYVTIEQMESVGDTTYTQMRKMGYRRFHRMTRYDSNASDMKQTNRRKVGWFSSAWSTPIYTDTFVLFVQNGWFKLNSPFTIWECDKWEAHVKGEGGKVKYLASENSTDSGLLAAAMAAFCVNDMKSLTERTKKRFIGPNSRRAPKLDLEETRNGTTFSAEDVSRYNIPDANGEYGFLA